MLAMSFCSNIFSTCALAFNASAIACPVIAVDAVIAFIEMRSEYRGICKRIRTMVQRACFAVRDSAQSAAEFFDVLHGQTFPLALPAYGFKKQR